jgi:hypothetical protein
MVLIVCSALNRHLFFFWVYPMFQQSVVCKYIEIPSSGRGDEGGDVSGESISSLPKIYA